MKQRMCTERETGSMKTKRLPKDTAALPMLALCVAATIGVLAIVGCKSSSSDQTAQTSQASDQTQAAPDNNPQDQGDPANANLAPIPVATNSSTTSQASSQAPEPAPAPQSAPAPQAAQQPPDYQGDQVQGDQYDASQNYSDTDYNPAPAEYAQEPPPPLPDYQQPPIP